MAALLVGHEVSTWLIRTVKALTASEVPVIGNPNTGVVPSVEAIWTFEVKTPLLVGWNPTWNVHEPPASTVAVEPHGREPALRFSENAGLEVAEKAMEDTLSGAVPVLRIVTSSGGTGVLPVVTLPKSKVAGRTCKAGLGPAGGAGVAPDEPPPPPPPPQPARTNPNTITAVKRATLVFMPASPFLK